MKAWHLFYLLACFWASKKKIKPMWESCSYLCNYRLICIISSSLKPSIQLSPTPRAPHTSALPPCLLETAIKALSTWYPSVCTSETESSRKCSIPSGLLRCQAHEWCSTAEQINGCDQTQLKTGLHHNLINTQTTLKEITSVLSSKNTTIYLVFTMYQAQC